MSNVVLVVTGSIACTLFWKIQQELEKENNVKVLFTEAAKIIAKKDLEYYFMDRETAIFRNCKDPAYDKISGRGYKYCSIDEKYKKYSCSFPIYYHDGEIKVNSGLDYESYLYRTTGKIEHIELCNWADKVVVAPCTMNTMIKMCNGITDSFVMAFLSAFLGTSKLIYVALAMNTNMYNNSALKYFINQFNDKCIYITPTVKKLACGQLGIGALAYIGTIVNIVNGHKWETPIKKEDLNNYSYDNFKDYIPYYTEPGSFGFKRKYEIHNGVDIYCKDGSDVFAVEDGQIVDIKPFTGKQNGTDWWNDTWAICIKGKSGVVCYGEMQEKFNFKIGDKIKVGNCIGKIKAVLPEHKKRNDIRNHNNAMLHIQLFKDYQNDEQLADWYPNEERNKLLLDPTPYLSLINI